MRKRKHTSNDVVQDALSGGNVEMGGVYVEKKEWRIYGIDK